MRRCRTCKKHAIAKEAPKSVWWCSPACKVYRNGVRMTGPTKAKAKPKKKKLKSIARVVDDCAVLLQRLVRLKAANWAGYVECVTCTKDMRWLPWQDAHGGHFVERGKLSTKLIVENVHPQCPGCNMFRMKTASGVLDYRRYMVGMYGEELVRDLELLAKQPKKYNRQEVAELADEFRRQIKEQEARLGIS